MRKKWDSLPPYTRFFITVGSALGFVLGGEFLAESYVPFAIAWRGGWTTYSLVESSRDVMKKRYGWAVVNLLILASQVRALRGIRAIRQSRLFGEVSGDSKMLGKFPRLQSLVYENERTSQLLRRLALRRIPISRFNQAVLTDEEVVGNCLLDSIYRRLPRKNGKIIINENALNKVKNAIGRDIDGLFENEKIKEVWKDVLDRIGTPQIIEYINDIRRSERAVENTISMCDRINRAISKINTPLFRMFALPAVFNADKLLIRKKELKNLGWRWAIVKNLADFGLNYLQDVAGMMSVELLTSKIPFVRSPSVRDLVALAIDDSFLARRHKHYLLGAIVLGGMVIVPAANRIIMRQGDKIIRVTFKNEEDMFNYVDELARMVGKGVSQAVDLSFVPLATFDILDSNSFAYNITKYVLSGGHEKFDKNVNNVINVAFENASSGQVYNQCINLAVIDDENISSKPVDRNKALSYLALAITAKYFKNKNQTKITYDEYNRVLNAVFNQLSEKASTLSKDDQNNWLLGNQVKSTFQYYYNNPNAIDQLINKKLKSQQTVKKESKEDQLLRLF